MRFAFVLVAVLAFLVLFPGCAGSSARTGTANAGVTRRPYTVASGPYAMVDPPQRSWTDEEGVLHVHGFSAVGPMAGDFGGTIFLVQYEDIDTKTGEGKYQGHFVWRTMIEGRTGYFEGSFNGKIHGFTGEMLSGQYTDEQWAAQGKEGLKEMKIQGTTWPGTGLGPYMHQGVLLARGGH
jgi:hypothetical protein